MKIQIKNARRPCHLKSLNVNPTKLQRTTFNTERQMNPTSTPKKPNKGTAEKETPHPNDRLKGMLKVTSFSLHRSDQSNH